MCCSTLSLRQGAKIYWLSFKKCGTPGRQNTIRDGGILYMTHQMSRKKKFQLAQRQQNIERLSLSKV